MKPSPHATNGNALGGAVGCLGGGSVGRGRREGGAAEGGGGGGGYCGGDHGDTQSAEVEKELACVGAEGNIADEDGVMCDGNHR